MNNEGKFTGIDAYTLDTWRDDSLRAAVGMALRVAGVRVVRETQFHFKPHGLTYVWILSESHCALHTYPESNYFTVDLYTCGQRPYGEKFLKALREIVPIKRMRVIRSRRGGDFSKPSKPVGKG